MEVGGFLMGFRKIGTDRWEFANEDFVCGKRALLKNINRRRPSQVQQVGRQMDFSVMVVKSGAENEVQKLKREKDQLMEEVVQLREEHLMTAEKIDTLNQRIQSAEMKQKQMVSFLAKVLQNSVFLGRCKQLKEQREIASTRVRRRFLKQQQPSFCNSDETIEQQIVNIAQDAITPEQMAPDEISPMSLSFSRPEATTFAFKGKAIVSTEAIDVAAQTNFLDVDAAQNHTFPDAITPASDCVTEEGIWNAGLESVGSSSAPGCDFWDSVGCYDIQEIDGVTGSCSLWDFNLEEYLDIEKFVGAESSLQ